MDHQFRAQYGKGKKGAFCCSLICRCDRLHCIELLDLIIILGEIMKLSIFERKAEKKSDTKKVRREEKIPAILYGLNQAPRMISLKTSEMQSVLRSLQPQLLATTVFELLEGEKTHRVLVKDIQYHPTSYAVEHIDFMLLSEEVPITVNVPVQIHGAMECIGVKAGGFIRHVIRSLKVRCLPRDLPKEFILNVQNLDLAGVLRLSDVVIPEGVKPLAKMNEVAVVIAKKV